MVRNHQRKKLRVVKNTTNEDYISKLPISILCNILSSLKVREAVETSVLSSKWRHIYANPNNLIFDAENILKRENFANFNISSHLSEVLKYEIKMNRARAFVSGVNQYLSRVENVQKIDKLSVHFTFRHNRYGSSDLDQWIRFAVHRNVEEIELSLLEENHHLSAPNDGPFYIFPCDIVGNNASGFNFKSLKRLRLAHCVLAPHKPYNSGFGTITKLELLKVDLKSEENIQNLLSSCNNLEWLAFSECYNMECLKIEYPSCPKLKYLNVNLCRQLKAIFANCCTLEILDYEGFKIKFVFNAPRLKTVFSRVSDSTGCNRENGPVYSFPMDLPQLENLILECSCYMDEAMIKRLPTFQNLRHLEVIKVDIFRQDLWWVARILEAFPTIRRLRLHLRTYFPIEELREKILPPSFPHNHLKEVAITGVNGHSSEIEIAKYLLQSAISLEKMTIDPCPRKYLGNGKWDRSQACESWSWIGKQKFHDHLVQEASSSVQLLIV